MSEITQSNNEHLMQEGEYWVDDRMTPATKEFVLGKLIKIQGTRPGCHICPTDKTI